jgi:hypothetical protein
MHECSGRLGDSRGGSIEDLKLQKEERKRAGQSPEVQLIATDMERGCCGSAARSAANRNKSP